ncbi:MAG: hypothetical protein J6U96_00380 [Elusimicrobiaceae bacterium]|nr:hypothetical protein [Elusimicrobiaceae bacterium]
MAKDMLLKRVFAWSVLTCVVLVFVVFYVHNEMQLRQLEREIIYRQAHALAAQQRREQAAQYRQHFEEQRLRRQYNQGRIVGVNTSSVR